MLFQIKKLLFSDKEIAFKQSNFSWQKLGRGRLEVAGRWKDEVKACPAHKSGGEKVKKKSGGKRKIVLEELTHI